MKINKRILNGITLTFFENSVIQTILKNTNYSKDDVALYLKAKKARVHFIINKYSNLGLIKSNI